MALAVSVWAFILSWLPYLEGAGRFAIIVFGVLAGYWAWRKNRAEAVRIERLNEMGIQPRRDRGFQEHGNDGE